MARLCQDLRPLLQAELPVLVGVGVPEGVLQRHEVAPLAGLLLLERQEAAAHVAGNREAGSKVFCFVCEI